MVSFITEFLTFGAQILGLQAGYGYASVVDPTTQADSDVLPVLAQLTGGLLFFTTGLHRYVISAFAASLERYPPGQFAVTPDLVQNGRQALLERFFRRAAAGVARDRSPAHDRSRAGAVGPQ